MSKVSSSAFLEENVIEERKELKGECTSANSQFSYWIRRGRKRKTAPGWGGKQKVIGLGRRVFRDFREGGVRGVFTGGFGFGFRVYLSGQRWPPQCYFIPIYKKERCAF